MTSSIPIEYKYILNRSIWSIDGTVTGIITSGQSGTWSMAMKGVPHIPRFSKLEPHNQMQFNLILSDTHFGEGFTSLQGIQAVYTKPTDRVLG